mgnify:FL=1
MMNDLMDSQAQQMDLQQATRRHFFSQCSMGLGSIALGSLLGDGLAKAAKVAGVAVQLQRIGSMSCCYFANAPVHNMAEAMQRDRDRFGKYFHGMLEEGVYIAPSQFEAGFVSAAHDEAAIEKTVAAASKVMKSL